MDKVGEAVEESLAAESAKEGVKTQFDFSKIDPEQVFLCFGTIEPEHQECKECPHKSSCAIKAGLKVE